MIQLFTPDEMARIDARSVEAGVSGATLMENAGAAVANHALARWRDARRIVVLAGPGDNGGDGFVAARLLKEAGRDVTLALLGEPSRLKGDAAGAARRWERAAGPLAAADIGAADLIIDALFGAGLSRPLDGEAARAAEAANASGRPILSIDVPSGLDGATGVAEGPCVRATETVTFVRLKPGHVLMPGRELCGTIHLADIGTPPAALADARAAAFLNRPELWRAALPQLLLDGHKYSRGHVAVWSGPELQTGASRLAALAAMRVGAGAVTLLGERDALKIHAAHVTAVMLREADPDEGWRDFLAGRRVTAAIVGPGAGATDRTRAAAERALARGCAVVLDADVFSLFEGEPDLFAVPIAKGRGEVVLTPHEGEFRRLFGPHPAGGASKLERTRIAAKRVGATLVLKGSDTVVASADGRASIADNAPPHLATAGSGDVLAGLIGGLLAQGMPAFEAASAAVWMHGEAGRMVGRGLIADDLPAAIPAVLQRLDAAAP